MADAGPLIALAKIDGLEPLFRLYPQVSIPLAVHDEAIRSGRERGATDALLLDEALHLSLEEAVGLVSRISARPDIWIHDRLCRQVIKALQSAGS